MKRLGILVKSDISATQIRLSGSLDLYSMNQFKSATDHINIQAGHVVLVDISGLTSLDSAGIGCLLRFMNMVKGPQGILYITQPPMAIEHVFTKTGLGKVFSFVKADREKQSP